MHVTSLTVQNYKSFASAGPLTFRTGFNVNVGQNNVGKTALLEALSLGIGSQPHRSLVTVPTPMSTPLPISSVQMTLRLDRGELSDILATQVPQFWAPAAGDSK